MPIPDASQDVAPILLHELTKVDPRNLIDSISVDLDPNCRRGCGTTLSRNDSASILICHFQDVCVKVLREVPVIGTGWLSVSSLFLGKLPFFPSVPRVGFWAFFASAVCIGRCAFTYSVNLAWRPPHASARVPMHLSLKYLRVLLITSLMSFAGFDMVPIAGI
ncbi:uncharacterized protein EI90DRAFT_1685210 [Cantharellus anzutake]|uniref:uncharacterized protein n=1 Tax=Cantharellus anzutake TaxID=1750568 RepID=UPI0019049808|nr:uncharacterized protein EI90DRAFT_1685210 [Cantharellus anzutake]KAF8327815.1 hypothetical protein EI90DRAFT_1685210 [Cantharellus anzutake]